MSDERDLLPEKRFLQHDLLGEGGTAKVWRAWHYSRRSWCAVKVLMERFTRQTLPRRRFIDEARTMIALDHRNVIQAWEVEEDAARPFLVMEVADGGSLNDWMSRYGPLPPHMAVGVAIQICKGVAAAHRANVIHRDIKPHNILINRKGVCKVTDFGIARIRRQDGSDDVPDATTVHTTGKVVGTLGYMAPEQLSDPRSADKRADVYGIGATLYNLLTDRQTNNLFMMFREEPERLEGIPAVLHPLLVRAVAYAPEERFDTVDELARALHRLRNELAADPPNTPQLTHELRPEPLPPQGASQANEAERDLDDLEVPTTSIRKEESERSSFVPPPIPKQIESTARPSWPPLFPSPDAAERIQTPQSGPRKGSQSPDPPKRVWPNNRPPRRDEPTLTTISEPRPRPQRGNFIVLVLLLLLASVMATFAVRGFWVELFVASPAKRLERALDGSLSNMLKDHSRLLDLDPNALALDPLHATATPPNTLSRPSDVQHYIDAVKDVLVKPPPADKQTVHNLCTQDLKTLEANYKLYANAVETWRTYEGGLGWLASNPPEP